MRVVGKHCESGDMLLHNAKVPEDLTTGDYLATPVTGAYGFGMGSNYNRLARPAVVFVKDGARPTGGPPRDLRRPLRHRYRARVVCSVVKTVVLGPLPAELEALIARRRKLGLDRYDEIWAGDYHMAPAAHFWHGRVDSELARVLAPHARRVGLLGTTTFNLGSPDNFRVPDGGLHRSIANSAWLPTAAIVIEVVSPDDETWEKLEFYASHGVEELIIADPQTRRPELVRPSQRRWHRLPPTRAQRAARGRCCRDHRADRLAPSGLSEAKTVTERALASRPLMGFGGAAPSDKID